MKAKNNITPLHSDAAHSPVDELGTYIEVLEGMQQGIIVWSDGVCSLVNQRYFEITGSSKAHLYPGYTWADHVTRLISLGQYTQAQADDVELKMSSGEIFSAERETENGTIISLTIRPLRSGGHVVSITDVTEKKHDEEIHARALNRAEKAEAKAQRSLSELQIRQVEVDKLSEFGDWLHSCKSVSELYEIVNQAMQHLYPQSSGELYIYSNSRDVLDGVCSWGNSVITENIQAQDCWSLRRGRVFEYGEGMIHLSCSHVNNSASEDESAHYVCLPLIANGDTVGLLHINLGNNQTESLQTESPTFDIGFAKRCAEQISLALANAQLRDELHEQSTRDPLTGLFNRRYFLERCRSEASRAGHQEQEFGLAVFDADDFKTFNDHYGHDAGDAVLCHIADIAHKHFVQDDVIARIGGEEFAILAPKTDASGFCERLEAFRDLVASMSVRYYNKPLPAVTISIGYAMSGDHGSRVSDLMKMADDAMYRSKDAGKNCVHQGEKPAKK